MDAIRALPFLFVVAFASFVAPAQAQSTITIGDTNLESAADSGNGNLVLAQKVALSESATIESLSFYVTQAAGDLILGVYDATGSKGDPGKLLATTRSFATVDGWNTANVVTPVSLAAGNYWLAYLPSSGALGFLKQNDSGNCFYKTERFSAGMPAGFSTSPSNCTPTTWSFYATLAPSGSDVAINGACGSANGADLTTAPTTNLCSAGAASTVTGSGPWNWQCAGSGGGSTANCSARLEVNGSCGSANGVPVSTAPTTNLCTGGTASSVSGTGPWTWSCRGTNGGATASCAAPLAQQVVNGSCGAANGAPVSSAPTTNLCSAGTASTVAGSGPWEWSCVGSDGGSTSSCAAPLAQQLINGACGSANGLPVSKAPTTNLCAAGTASTVSGTGPWDWTCAGSNGGSLASCQAPVGSVSSPVLIQHVASSANPAGLGIPGNNYSIPLPNAVLGGDALVLAITFPHGNTSVISDTLGQTWPAAAITEDGGSGNYVTQIYVLCGSATGSETIKVNLTQSGLPFEYTVGEFSNVATSGCVDGASGGANISPNGSGVISPGSFTPKTNNDANGGHVIWNYNAISSIATGDPTAWVAGTGFTLLDGDIAWTNKQGFPHASQWYLQGTNGSVSPAITASGDSVDRFNSVSVSLLVAAAGGSMPSGIHINKIVHESWVAASGAALTLELPTTGNLRVLAFTVGQDNINITSITDSDGGVWQVEQTGGDSAQIWFAANVAPNPTLMVTIHTSGSSPTNSVRFFDIQGASTSPLAVAAGTDLTSCSSSGTIGNQPTITPTSTKELVIASMGIGQGPGLGMASGSPPGAVWDLTTYTGETDNDLMENADALGHVYTTATSVQNWNWAITSNPNNSCSAEAVAFK